MHKVFDKSNFLAYITSRKTKIASSSNGRTADSDSVNLGSSPGEAATVCKSSEMTTFSFIGRDFSEFEIDIVTRSICVTAEIRECNECHVRYEKSIKRDNLRTFLIKNAKPTKLFLWRE